MSQIKSNSIFSIQMFLDIAEIYFASQQSHIPDKNSYQIEYLSKNISQYEQIQSSTFEYNLDDISKNDCNKQELYHNKNSNIMKNILKSFQRFIENEQDEQQQLHFCRLINSSSGYSQLCKFLKFNLKTEGKRWNMKAKNLVEKSKMKPLFEFYLKNINKLWLNNSKVSNKSEHEALVGFLLNQIKHPIDSCRIRFYKKNKQIIKSQL
ncbi:hypothetical protein ABPG72_003903 [Tetrahymena utriculariae]